MPSENALLAFVAGFNGGLPRRVTIPPGDDMAAVEIGGGSVLIAVDQVVDGRHFVLSEAGPEAAGRKAVTRNLSDVAAMAAVPVAAVLAAALPRGMDQAVAERLLAAARETGAAYGCPVIGGDVSVTDGPLVLSVTVLAEPAGVEPVTRGPAAPGEGLWVSGVLGGSAAGHHLRFEPRLALARTLAADAATRPTAMIDLSDGLAADLPRIAPHAEVDLTRLPVRPGLPAPAWERAIGDGEDHELLFTLPAAATLPPRVAGVRVTRIGTAMPGGGLRWLGPGGSPLTPSVRGWEHRG
ncbi:thiamine-phosphate kinase [Phycisphaera mikurensis]|uniref:Thiamine-monophosphate kinase n=1 Tax=Phycisphaera mikurensis (strain NBRC 102666 / KCTC 22515 / FYK2301M01) TaxID=1142394 RepID=I0IHV8_PHYMF|nr:thiamine-phosphate kinase [Phycisphaera mikurensis]MBB6441087.1 thiamine-monophosphate kinase [Phycisphaera mikurensis]BAM04846.1 putative thiamine-monophosphate kinase [Phycisphaera mikurensis NBRC 102666]